MLMLISTKHKVETDGNIISFEGYLSLTDLTTEVVNICVGGYTVLHLDFVFVCIHVQQWRPHPDARLLLMMSESQLGL